MLIKKAATVAPGDIVAFKLVTGDEVIGKLVSVEQGLGANYVVDRPVVLQVQPTPKGLAMAFAPLMVAADEDRSFVFEARNIALGPIKARQEIAANFIQATTGLAVPTAGETAGLIRL